MSAIYSGGLVVGALTIGSTDVVSSYGRAASQTLVQANGPKVLLVVAIPLLGVILVAVSTLLRRRSGRLGVSIISWSIVVVLTLYCIAGVLTVGLFALPVPLLLFGALGSVSEGDLRQ